MSDHPVLRWLVAAVLGVVTAAAVSLLAMLSHAGLDVRPTADDWCVLWKTRDLGLLGITRDFYLTQNGRLANAFVSGVVSVDGPAGMRILPAVLVVLFGVGLFLLARQTWRILGWRAPVLVFVTVAAVVETVLFAGSRNPYQALLWAPGSISHTLPTIIAVWAVYLGLRAGGSRRWWVRAGSLVGVLLVGAFLGTLTEPSLVMLGLLAGAAGLCCVPWPGLVRTWHPFLWCAAACAGLVAGFAVLYTSPGAALRREHSPPPPPLLSGRSLAAAAKDWQRIMDIVTSQWTWLGLLVVGVLAGALTAASERAPVAVPRRVLRVAAFALLPPLLLLGSFLVVLGVRQGYPVYGWMQTRIWFNFLAPMALALCWYGVLAGRSLRRLLERRGRALRTAGIAAVSVLAGALLVGCAAALLPAVRQQRDFTAARARAFDAQDARIREQAERGETEAVYAPLRVPGLAEPATGRPGSRTWVNDCAARYYRVEKVVPPPKPPG